MSEKNWKHHLLKSGLPFEYEIKECFVKNNCTVWDEYSYLKEDENKVEKEFSYDLDVNYWTGNYSMTFMVECKYKTEPTKWFFLPDPYSYQDDITQNSFLHPIDYFTENKFLFKLHPFCNVQSPLGPFCLKGVEIYQNQFLETNIFKAINQLSFAFIEQLIISIESQLEVFPETVFFNIPIIVTNAELYLINEKLTTADIENSENIEEVSERHDFLFFHNKIGESLKKYNSETLTQFFKFKGEETFNTKNKSFTKDLSHFIDVLSENYCPEIILIMHHDNQHDNFKKLFDYINFIMKPSDELEKKKIQVKENFENEMEKIKNSITKRK